MPQTELSILRRSLLAVQEANDTGRAYVGLPACWNEPHDDIVNLDEIRANAMRAMLAPEGQRYIGCYDAGRARFAYQDAKYRQSYDDIVTGAQALIDGKPYAFIGSGICDHYFTTPAELLMLCRWVCLSGYLSCYKREAA